MKSSLLIAIHWKIWDNVLESWQPGTTSYLAVSESKESVNINLQLCAVTYSTVSVMQCGTDFCLSKFTIWMPRQYLSIHTRLLYVQVPFTSITKWCCRQQTAVHITMTTLGKFKNVKLYIASLFDATNVATVISKVLTWAALYTSQTMNKI